MRSRLSELSNLTRTSSGLCTYLFNFDGVDHWGRNFQYFLQKFSCLKVDVARSRDRPKDDGPVAV